MDWTGLVTGKHEAWNCVVNTHDYQAGAGQEQQLLVSFLQWDWVFLAPMILILSGVHQRLSHG